MVQTTLIDFFQILLGDVPPEFEGLVYVFALFVLLYIIDSFFMVLSSIFGVTKWK